MTGAERRPAPEDPAAGLCATCAHARRIRSRRGSVYWLCGKAAEDPTFAKYPRLPVLRCPGWQGGRPTD